MICPSCAAENDDAAQTCSACGRALPPRPIGAGSLIAGRYEILGSLGVGGMGLVFKARDRALNESVALKVLRASASRDPALAQRFRSEIKLAWKVRHRNVCGIHEYGEDGDLLYISMELVEGRDLRQLLREGGALPWEAAYDVATQTAEGLLAIHEAGVIHRDLKPANITRDNHGLVRLMDFGIAKVWGEESGAGVTGTGQVVGSPEYMSPEQVRGKPIDFRSDLYSLGLVIYEIFTGRVPFQADTPAASMLRRLEEDAALEGSDATLIPSALVPVLRRALARDPDERFATCGELLAALREARDALPQQVTDELAPLAPGTTRAVGPPAAPSQAELSQAPTTAFPRAAQARLLVPQLAKALAHEATSVRLGAAQALGRIGADARAALPALVQALEDEAPDVREAATAALGLIGEPADLAPDEPPAAQTAPAAPARPEAPVPAAVAQATPAAPEGSWPRALRVLVVALVAAVIALVLWLAR